jgi:hypothetical protein
LLSNFISHAHKGPIFSIYTTLTDGCLVTGAKEKTGYKLIELTMKAYVIFFSFRTKDSFAVKVWDKDLKTSKNFNVDNRDVSVVKSVARIKVITFSLNNYLFKHFDKKN